MGRKLADQGVQARKPSLVVGITRISQSYKEPLQGLCDGSWVSHGIILPWPYQNQESISLRVSHENLEGGCIPVDKVRSVRGPKTAALGISHF